MSDLPQTNAELVAALRVGVDLGSLAETEALMRDAADHIEWLLGLIREAAEARP